MKTAINPHVATAERSTPAARLHKLLGCSIKSDAKRKSRGSFLIDEEGVVRHQVVNDLPLGRNIDEMLRMVDALNFHQKHGEVCPAQWEEGKAGMDASPQGVAAFLSENAADLA